MDAQIKSSEGDFDWSFELAKRSQLLDISIVEPQSICRNTHFRKFLEEALNELLNILYVYLAEQVPVYCLALPGCVRRLPQKCNNWNVARVGISQYYVIFSIVDALGMINWFIFFLWMFILSTHVIEFRGIIITKLCRYTRKANSKVHCSLNLTWFKQMVWKIER